MNTNFIVNAENISYKVNDNKLFHNLSFVIEEGEAMHVKGSNGSGKSTLIRIILGITKQTKGNILVNTNREICYLGHKNALKNYLSLDDNILLMDLTKHPDLKQYIELLGFKKLLDVNVANLSYGQQKKLALLRLFLNDSDLIVLDEPFVGLDKETQEILNNFLVNQLNKNKAIIYTSHISCPIDSKELLLR
jgi:heme exporter protein A